MTFLRRREREAFVADILYWLLRISVPKQSRKQHSEYQYRSLLDGSRDRKRT
jgi:hypothetical protein